MIFGNESKAASTVSPVRYGSTILREEKEVTYLEFPADNDMSSRSLYRATEVKLFIQMDYLRRWWVMKKDVMPFELARTTIRNLMRSSTATWLPYLTEAETKKLEVKEGQFLREVMSATRRHPNIAFWHDLRIRPLTTQRDKQVLTVRDGMETYAPDCRMSDRMTMDRALSKTMS
jgi:hypothetical protein